MIDSVYKKDKNYYPQVFLERCDVIFIEKKMSNFNGGIKIYSDEEIYSYNEDFDEEHSDDCGDSDENTLIKKFR